MSVPIVARESRRGRPRSTNAEELEIRIVNAAYSVFLENGFQGSTTEMVASAARISKRSIYEVFASKDELFASVVASKRHLILDLQHAETDISFLDRLTKLFRLDIDEEAFAERQAMLELLTREVSASPQLTERLYDQGALRTREDLIVWLLIERDAKHIAFEDVELVASMLMNLVFGTLLPRRKNLAGFDRARRIEHIRKSLEIMLLGLEAFNKVAKK